MLTKIRAHFTRQEGQTMAEYAVVLAVITVATDAAGAMNPDALARAIDAAIDGLENGDYDAVLTGGIEKPITPTNVRIVPESNHGSAQVRPANVANRSSSPTPRAPAPAAVPAARRSASPCRPPKAR